MRYKDTIENKLEQISTGVDRLVERVDDNTITKEEVSAQLARVSKLVTEVVDLVELED
jgi:methyl-accepting chemotaxis protein|tara:strand:- start:1787 stop:1960 length:174 start_codon:yes stop_codon:yes gene_type:complete